MPLSVTYLGKDPNGNDVFALVAKNEAGNTAPAMTVVDQDGGSVSVATAGNQVLAKGVLDSILAQLTALVSEDAGLALASKQDAAKAVLDSMLTQLQALVSEDAGLALASKQDAGNTVLANILTQLQTLVSEDAGLATATNQMAAKGVLDNILTKLGAVVIGPGSDVIGKLQFDHSAIGSSDAVVVGVIDSAGGLCFPDRYSHTLNWNSDGTLNTDTFTDGSHTWTTTYSYANGLATTISNWVKS